MYWTYPLEMEQRKKSIFACWGLKNEHTKNPPDIEVKHSTLNWDFGDSSISFPKLSSQNLTVPKTHSCPEMEPPFNLTLAANCRWGVMIFDHVSCSFALSHVCMCKKAEAKEKVEKKQRFKGYSGKGAKLKSAIQNPSLVDPKHSSLFFLVRVSCAQLLQVSGGGT